MVLPIPGLGPAQIAQLLASIGTKDPAQLAELLASVGFKPPQPGGGAIEGAIGGLVPPTARAATPTAPPRPPSRPPPTTTLPSPPPAAPEESKTDAFLRALAAVEVPQPPVLPSAPSISGVAPRGGGTVDPRQLAALLQLLATGQGAPQATPALGNLIGGIR